MFLYRTTGENTYLGFGTSMAKIYNNVYCMYITNHPYDYPDYAHESVEAGSIVSTGWHVLPNQMISHFMTPAQWADLIDHSSTYQISSISMELFNLVPLTETLSLSGQNTLWTFNNCLYALGYSDEYRETSYYNWMSYGSSVQDQTKLKRFPKANCSPNLLYKEGKQCSGESNWIQYTPPLYGWQRPLYRIHSTRTYANSALAGAGIGVYPCTSSGTQAGNKQPGGLIWDPFNNPDALMELRPGKNSMKFSHTFEHSPVFNSDMFAYMSPYTATGPYQGNDRPGTFQQTLESDPDMLTSRNEGNDGPFNDFTIPNFAFQPLVPSGWWWKEIKESIMDITWLKKPNLHWTGTEREMCCDPPPQWFCKVLPLFRASPIGGSPTLIDCIANVAVRTSITINTTPRHSAIYCPTHGPWSWWDLYSHLPWYHNYKLAGVRGRAGGLRRTWQNYEFTSVDTEPALGGGNAHRREDPYKESVTITSGCGTGSTYTATLTHTIAKQPSIHETTTTESGTQPIPKTRWYHNLRKDLKTSSQHYDNPNFTMEED